MQKNYEGERAVLTTRTLGLNPLLLQDAVRAAPTSHGLHLRIAMVPVWNLQDWKWCGHDELLSRRKRYRILNIDRLL